MPLPLLQLPLSPVGRCGLVTLSINLFRRRQHLLVISRNKSKIGFAAAAERNGDFSTSSPSRRSRVPSLSKDRHGERSNTDKKQWQPLATSVFQELKGNEAAASATATADWRTWFKSIEYDDPWSSYRSLLLQPHANTNQNTTVVDNMLTNYNNWERRRHGMNLVPLSLSNSSPSSSTNNHHQTTDTNDDINYEIQQLSKRIQWIDTQTRFTIQMLNDLYYTGVRRQMDRPTTERCHRMIGRLLSLTPTATDDDDKNNNSGIHGDMDQTRIDVVVYGAAQRGNAILERMEKCSPAFLPQLRKWQRKQQLRSGGGILLFNSLSSNNGIDDDVVDDHDDVSESSSASSATTPTNYYQNKIPQHLVQTKQVLPTPTLAIYTMVLLLYKKEVGSRYVAEQAEDVLWGMIVRGLQLEEFYKLHNSNDGDGGGGGDSDNSDSGIDTSTTNHNRRKGNEEKELEGGGPSSSSPMYPTTQHWNCVLECWSNSTEPNRAFYAYSFFKSWMEWNGKYNGGGAASNVRRGGGGVGEEEESCINLESFHLILKACLVEESTTFDNDENGNATTTQRAKEIGSRVAIGLWKDMRDLTSAEITLTSHTYNQLLRVLCQTSDVSRGLLSTVAKVFQRCRSDGMDTIQIADLVRGVMTEAQFEKLVKIGSEEVTSASPKPK